MSDKPVPVPSSISRPFWDAAADERLVYQFCADCARAQFYPRARCSHCGSAALEWRDSAGHCTVHAVTHVHIGMPAFKEDVPYDIVMVDVDEGFRMLVNSVNDGDPDHDQIAIGDRGRIVFERRGELALPQFRK